MICIIFLIFLLGVTGCNNEKFDIEANNRLFFNDKILYEDNGSIENLTIYYYESYYYYDVEVENSTTNYHFLYVYRYNQFQIRYSIKHPELDLDYYPTSYFNYLDAKEKGESKAYTKEMIDSLVDYYQSFIEE